MRIRAVALAAVAALLLPSTAVAATAYVDAGGSAVTGCTTPANPCGTIADGIATAGLGGEIVVDDGGSFTEQVTLSSGQVLRVANFDGVPAGLRSFIDGGAGSAVTITAPNATVSSFHLRGDTRAVDVQAANATLSDNVFDEGAGNAVALFSDAGADGLLLQRNIFLDGFDHSDSTTGAAINADATITDNTFEDFNRGVVISSPAVVTMTGNNFMGIHEDPGNRIGVGLLASAGDVTMTASNNSFNAAGVGEAHAIALTQPGSTPISATLRRIYITAHDVGVWATNTAAVSLESSVIAENSIVGLRLTDTGGGGNGDANASNLTFWNNGLDIDNQGAALTLDSSIVQSAIAAGPGASCAITFSRGPMMASGCNGFQTTADPMLAGVDAFGDFNYALRATSPMIDAGNPAPPELTARDFQGEPRAVDGPPACFSGVARRDIGADEFVPVPSDCAEPAKPDLIDPETEISSGPKRKLKTAKAKAKARFTFSSNEAGSTFECSLDGKAFSFCQSPAKFMIKAKSKLKPHELRVRAIDAAGNRDESPAEYRWRVKRTGR